MVIFQIQGFKGIMKLRFFIFLFIFSYFAYELKIKTSAIHEHVIYNQEHVKNTYNQHSRISRTFKHIQGI